VDEITQLVALLRGDNLRDLLIAFLIVGGMREWYVWGPTHRKAIAREEELKAIVFRALRVTKEAVNAAN